MTLNIEHALASSPLLLFTVSKEGRLQAISGADIEKLGLDKKDLLGSSPLRNHSIPITRSHFKKAMAGEKITFTTNIKNYVYETILTPEANKDGEIIGCSGFSIDVSNRIKMEQALDEERYRATAAQRINSLAGMANGLAHEINNPLAIISGFAQQIEEMIKSNSISSPIAQKFINRIIENCERIHQIITGLQNFSRDAGNDPLEDTSLKEILNHTERLCIRRFEEAGVKLDILRPEKDFTIPCRSIQIQQILFNLLINGLDAINDDKNKGKDNWVRLEISKRGKLIEITVQDSGPGIPSTNRSKIFEPFYTTKEVGEGTGLGLSTAKGLAESHGGTLDIKQNEPNTTFVLEIPAAAEKLQTG